MESLSALGDGPAYLAGMMLIVAFAMTSVRAMRLAALGAGIMAIVYLLGRGAGMLWLGLGAAFVLVNLAQLGVFWRRARSGIVLEHERLLFEQLLGTQGAGRVGRLRDLIRWSEHGEGETLITQGQAQPPLVYVASGAIRVEADGVEIGRCMQGDFLGEMSLLSGRTASATATVIESARVARFDRDALAAYVRAVPEVGHAITHALNRGLAAKVERMNASVARKDK